MSYSNGPRIVTNGLVLYLDAGSAKSYPGSGTVWNDLSGNGNNGTLINGPTYSTSNKGSIVFDGVDDYVSVTENSGMKPQILTLEFAAKINSTVNSGSGSVFNFQYIIFRQNSRTTNFEGYNITYGETNAAYGMGSTPSGGTPQYGVNATNNSSPIGKISFITALFDNTSMSIYVDGIFQASGPKASGINYNSTHTLKIGRSVPIGNAFDSTMNGAIYFVRLYNRILSSDEISQNYNATKARYNL